jgi:3',5'-cyclic AMP phosphodiesterase CpdA
VQFVAISDTHNKHGALELPPGDVLLHTGDMTVGGTLDEVEAFASWWHAQRQFSQRIVIAGAFPHTLLCIATRSCADCPRFFRESGNHDHVLDEKYIPDTKVECAQHAAAVETHGCAVHAHARALLHRPQDGSFYLQDSGCVTNRGDYTVYGSPWQPAFWGSFNLPRGGEALAQRWAAVPDGTHVVMTHGPAHGQRDYVPRSQMHVGCKLLDRELRTRVRPAVAVSGHIHEGAGVCWSRGESTAFVNASSCDLHYEPTNAAIVFQLRREGGDARVICHMLGYDAPATAE